jgi:heme/copper-type cytochrome/quinol oxidase subunit 4
MFLIFILKLHKYKKEKEIYISLTIYLTMISFNLFSKTELFYQYGYLEIHLIYIIFVIQILLYILYLFLINNSRMELMLFPFTAYAFIILTESPISRFYLLLFHLQYNDFVLPILHKINGLFFSFSKSVYANPKVEKSFEFIYPFLLHLVAQVYFISFPFFQFIIGLEEKFSIDARIFFLKFRSNVWKNRYEISSNSSWFF